MNDEKGQIMNFSFSHLSESLMGRTLGPLSFRFFLQPIVGILLGMRAGFRDSENGRTPYLFAFFTEHATRQENLTSGWKDIRKLFILAITLDVVYQLIIFRWIYLGQALIIAIVLAVIPYTLTRGFSNRIHPRTQTK